jgi:H+/Cl- antiporter ClcA
VQLRAWPPLLIHHLGGIVFAIEELTKTHFSYFKTAIFSSVIIAGLSAQALLGPYLYLGYPRVDSFVIIHFFGCCTGSHYSGLLGRCMSKIILIIFAWKARFKSNYEQVTYVAACALIMVSLAFFVKSGSVRLGQRVNAAKPVHIRKIF